MSSSQHSGQGAPAPASSPPAATAGAITVGAIVTVLAMFVLFLIIAFGLSSLNYCLSCLDRRSRGAPTSPSALGRRRRRRSQGGGAAVADRADRTRGVDPELLRSLPVTVYRAKGASSADEVEECAVCLAALEDGEAARFLPRCGHGFHAECVDTWLASHTTCPLCRLTVAKPPAPALPEPANYAASVNLPASVLLGVPHHHPVAAPAPFVARATMLVIEIPESAAPMTTCNPAKSPGSARMRSIRRLWSFGRQGAPGPSSSCCCADDAGGSERADVVEQGGISVTIDVAVADDAQLPSEVAGGAVRGASA
jgi:E3 ubiquitin-protein ligase EL5